MATYLKLYNNAPNRTIKDFSDLCKIGFTTDFTLEKFFQENAELILAQLSEEKKQEIAKQKNKTVEELTTSDIDISIELPNPCYLSILEKYVSYSLIIQNTNFQVAVDSTIAFQDEQIKNTFQDNGFSDVNNYRKIEPKVRVIGWFKTLFYENKNKSKSNNQNIDNIYDLNSNFLDISKYIIGLNTSSSSSGGNFSFTLPHIPLYPSVGSSSFDEGAAISSKQGNLALIDMNYQNQDTDYIKSTLDSFDYFDWLMQSNDLIFISFNGMDELTDDNLANKNYDMIGLIDSVSLSKDSNGNMRVDVSGRDLMKVITEDSSIFFYQSVANGDSNVFKRMSKGFDNTETCLQGGDVDSLFTYNGAKLSANGTTRQLNGAINVFACEPNDLSIDFVIKTVVSHLANMNIVPDDLFVSWGNKRTRFSTLKPKKV